MFFSSDVSNPIDDGINVNSPLQEIAEAMLDSV